MSEFDPGPPTQFDDHFSNLPDLSEHKALFWYSWGPVFYRGRLDGSARILCIASDPGPTERIACRTLVGDAGQRVQGFLTKLGLTRSYILVNAHPYALFPSRGAAGRKLLAEHGALKLWRNTFYDMLKTPSIKAVVAFGEQAQKAYELWPAGAAVQHFPLLHPSSRNPETLATAWRGAITQLRALITPDSDGDNSGPNYGATIKEADYAPIPKRDLPWGLPGFVGDDAWVRRAKPKRNNAVERPDTDIRNTLLWRSPRV
jgi:uracil-DNA glycosylase